MKKRLIMQTVLVITLIMGIGTLSFAQKGNCPMMKDAKCQMPKDGHHMGKGKGMDCGMMFQQLNLTDQQQEQVKAVMDKHQSEMQGFNEKIDAARKAVHEAVHTDTFNETAIRDAHKTLATEMENMAVLRGKIFAEIRPILTPEQLTQVKEMRDRKSEKKQNRKKCPAMTEE
jgi:Spy/CpxP family protein refolding chaperone